MAVALITRKSTRDDAKVSLGRQEALGREWAQQHRPGVPVLLFEDAAVSGTVMDRPGWVAFTDALKAGVITDVWAWEQSRLTRAGVTAWDDVCRLLSAAGIYEVHTHRQGQVRVAEGDRLHGSINSVMDQHEREVLRVRTIDGLEHIANEGRPTGSTGYGYRRIYGDDGRPILVPEPDEAAEVRRMVEAVAAGSSLGLVASELNERGVPTPSGAKQWRRESVKVIVTAPRIIGQRVHRGKVVGKALWDPIVDRSVWELAQQRIGQPVKRAGTRRRYLLSGGLAVCDACDKPLISASTKARGQRLPSYQCPSPRRMEKGCGKCSILAERLEPYVLSVVGEWLMDPAVTTEMQRQQRATQADSGPLRDELDRIDAQLADMAVQWASGDRTDIEYAAARRTFAERRQAITDELAALSPQREVTIPDLQAAWATGNTEDQRIVIDALARVRVRGAFHAGRRLTVEERVRVSKAWD